MPRPGRKRSEASRQRIVAASLEIMAERGYNGITVDEIAKRARVGKQTIYRWWQTRGEIMMEVLGEVGLEAVPAPGTGKLKQDLDKWLKGVVESLNDPTRLSILRGLIGDAQGDSGFLKVYRKELLAEYLNPLESILRDAEARGDLGKKPDLELLRDLVISPIWFRLLFGGDLDSGFAKSLSKTIFGALT